MPYIYRLRDNSKPRSEFMKKMVSSAIVKENEKRIAFLSHFMEQNRLDGQTEILKLTNLIENFQFCLSIAHTPYDEQPSANFCTTNYYLTKLKLKQKAGIVPRDALLEPETTSQSFWLSVKKRTIQITSKKFVLLVRSNELQEVPAGSKCHPELWISVHYLSFVKRLVYQLQHFTTAPIEYIPRSPLSHSEYVIRK